MINRRALITGLGVSLITAPAIIRAGSLMPVKTMQPAPIYWIEVDYTIISGAMLDRWAELWGVAARRISLQVGADPALLGMNVTETSYIVENDASLRDRIMQRILV
jgi:hypothetical protein